MLKKLELRWEKDNKDSSKQVCIRVEGVPKGKMKKLARKYGGEIRKEGVVEFFVLDFVTLSLKFVRHIPDSERTG